MKTNLPESILKFVNQQETIPILPVDRTYPYSDYGWKATACILLSGRIKPKSSDGFPNLADTNRICKEANFDQYYFFRMASFLLASEVIENHLDSYKKGKQFNTFWSGSLVKLQTLARLGLLTLVQRYTPFHSWRSTLSLHSGLIEFLILFFTSFGKRALRYDKIGELFLTFSRLPEKELIALAKNLAIRDADLLVYQWKDWLDPQGQQALIRALFDAGWTYVDQQQNIDWFFLSCTGRIILDLDSLPPKPLKTEDFRVLPNLCVFAGADLPVEKLIPLFRYCRIKRIDRIFEFQLDRKAMNEIPSRTSAGRELLNLLKELEPLPPGVRSLLEEKPEIEGVLRIQACSAIVIPENPAMLSTIKNHSKLKGYIDSGGPPGYLLVKSTSNPANFIKRCREYGFEVKPL
jgi:hypothetical protein